MGSTVQDQSPCLPAGAPTATVSIRKGPGSGQSIQLRRAVSLFGTKRGCKFVLRDPTVDRRHCVVVNTGYRIILRDLNTNGRTWLNGAKIEQEMLTDGQTIKIGPWEFYIEVTAADIRGASDSPVVVDLEPDPTLLAIEDVTSGHIAKLSRDVAILGRGPNSDFVVQDRETSRVHAIIFSYLGRPAIFDLASENGTWVNGQRAVFAMLQNGDELTFGSRTIRFRSTTQSVAKEPGTNGQASLKPIPFPNPDGTISDLIDISSETRTPHK